MSPPVVVLTVLVTCVLMWVAYRAGRTHGYDDGRREGRAQLRLEQSATRWGPE